MNWQDAQHTGLVHLQPLLTQHLLAIAAQLLSQRGVCRQSGHSWGLFYLETGLFVQCLPFRPTRLGNFRISLRVHRPILAPRRWLGGPVSTDIGLAVQALQMSIWRRKPGPGLLFNSDQGAQITGGEWAAFLREHNLEHSMSRLGNCQGNAVAESFFNC